MIKILMVCLGKICRSPLAEGILKSKMNPQNFLIDSAGTAAYHKGNAPDKRSIEVARKYGINIADQKARKFTIKDFDTFNYCIPKIAEKIKGLKVNVIIRKDFQSKIKPHANVKLHSGIDDFELKKMYQESSLLFLPLSPFVLSH